MKRVIAQSILGLAVAGGLFAATPNASAGERISIGAGFRDDRRVERCDVRRVWVEPIYEDRCSKVWVEPVYRTESVPVFVNGYYETQCDKVWVEPVFQTREVVRFEHGRRICTRERIQVCEGHFDKVERQVWVPEHYRHDDRQVQVCPGHFEERRERVCVREGRWDEVRIDRPREGFAFDFNIRR